MVTNKRFRSHHDSLRALAQALERTVDSERDTTLKGNTDNPVVPEFNQLLQTVPVPARRGVYIHVPFCDRICSFCSMNRDHSTLNDLRAYTDKLISQLDEVGKTPYVRGGDFDAIYFGGGTPTVLPTAELERVLSALVSRITTTESCEWTVETTLHNLCPEKLSLMREAGVNRLSIGIQTFSDRGRALLHRSGKEEWAVQKLEDIRKAFPGTLGIDLIYSYPGQTREEVLADAEWVKRLDIDSVSFYSLRVHSKSLLAERLDRKEVSFPRTLQSDFKRHNELYRTLLAGGYELLELTKMVKPFRDEYRYIKIRYANEDLLPLGRGAGGRVFGYKVAHRDFGSTLVRPMGERYSRFNRVLGYLQYGRYDAQILTTLCGDRAHGEIRAAIHDYEEQGYLSSLGEGKWRLTPEGVFWGNNLAADFLERVLEPAASKMGVCR